MPGAPAFCSTRLSAAARFPRERNCSHKLAVGGVRMRCRGRREIAPLWPGAFGLHPRRSSRQGPATGLAAFSRSHEHERPSPRLRVRPFPAHRSRPVLRPLLTSPGERRPLGRHRPAPPREPTSDGASSDTRGASPDKASDLLAHPPHLRDGPLMTTGFAVLAGSPGPPRLLCGSPPPALVPRVAASPPASFPPRLATTQLPLACGWCHLLHGGLAPPSCWSCRAYR